MGTQNSNSAILADRNAETSEGIRSLLDTEFDSVYLVATTRALFLGVERLEPQVVVVDQFLECNAMPDMLQKIRALAPRSGIVVLASNAHNLVSKAIFDAGADAIVLKRCAGTDLFDALSSIENGKCYVSPGFKHAEREFSEGIGAQSS